MTYQNQNEQKPDPTLERSAKYLSNYFKFNFKEDLAEVLGPLCSVLKEIGKAILGGKDGK